ncbi:pathogenesis-related thaumatin superfamily protein [Actinidia rufa]|uniref:Pathogenesis-related thaumatin superfamily protein n=1 Tax=Actinidia rufa TaxID=165716 RepID=A0A7J0D8D8_9ERIC|nr:pathogenesis-related thaumatin superfamily protein [Actinidia rufa]
MMIFTVMKGLAVVYGNGGGGIKVLVTWGGCHGLVGGLEQLDCQWGCDYGSPFGSVGWEFGAGGPWLGWTWGLRCGVDFVIDCHSGGLVMAVQSNRTASTPAVGVQYSSLRQYCGSPNASHALLHTTFPVLEFPRVTLSSAGHAPLMYTRHPVELHPYLVPPLATTIIGRLYPSTKLIIKIKPLIAVEIELVEGRRRTGPRRSNSRRWRRRISWLSLGIRGSGTRADPTRNWAS